MDDYKTEDPGRAPVPGGLILPAQPEPRGASAKNDRAPARNAV